MGRRSILCRGGHSGDRLFVIEEDRIVGNRFELMVYVHELSMQFVAAGVPFVPPKVPLMLVETFMVDAGGVTARFVEATTAAIDNGASIEVGSSSGGGGG